MSKGAVRCCVVGIGWMGRLHAACLAASPLAELAVCCDLDPEARERAPNGVRFTHDIEEAFAEPGLEAVVVCTPPHVHRPPVLAALARGLHVLCEKPFAACLEDCDAMTQAAAASSGRLVIGHIRRFDPRFTALLDAVQSGRVGRPLQLVGGTVCPREDAERLAASESLALECGVHDIDAMRWLAGDVERVYAEAIDVHPTRGPDAFVATLRFASGAIGALHHSWAMPTASGIDWEFRFHLDGVNGTADIDGRSRGVTILSPDPGHIFPDTITWPLVHGEVAGVLATEDGHFLAGVRDSRPWPIGLAAARAAVAGAIAIDRSIATGQPVDISPGEG